jgi:ribonuclease HI
VGSGDRYMRCYTLGMDTPDASVPDASVTDASVTDASVTVYTDGACRGNPGRGGWAWAVPGGPYASGADPATTNQRMEIKAALEALRYWRTQPVSEIDVVSDSTYVVNCFRDRWWQGWQRRGWLNSQKKPVANRDLWEPLIELAVGSEARVTWRWVKGHSGDRWNDRVDELATAAADSGHGDSDLR